MDEIEAILKDLKQIGIQMEKIDEHTWAGTKLGALKFFIRKEPHGLSFDCYAELSGGIYEIGELASITKNLLLFRETLLQHGAREINTTERLYPADRRGKNTKTSGL